MNQKPSRGDIKEWMKWWTPLLSVDFDGVIHDFVFTEDYSSWYNFYEPYPEAVKSLQLLKQVGFRIFINTVRIVDNELINWLHKHGISYDYLNGYPPNFNDESTDYAGFIRSRRAGQAMRFFHHNPDYTGTKPYADAYLDDKDLYHIGRKWDWSNAVYKLSIAFPNMAWKGNYTPPQDLADAYFGFISGIKEA